MTDSRLWTRDFSIVFAVNFLLVLVFYLLLVVIGLFATNELEVSASTAGLIAGVFIIGVLVGRVLVGQFIDRLGRKRSMLAGLFLTVLACLLYFIEGGASFLVANRFMHGFAVGIAATAVATSVAHLVPSARFGEGIGYFSMSSALATAVGPFIGIMLSRHADFRLILTLCSALSVLSLVIVLPLRVPEMDCETLARQGKGFSLSRLVAPEVVPVCSMMLLLGGCFSAVLSFLNIFAAERDLTEAASLFFFVYAVVLLLSRPFSGRLLDRRGANIIMYPALSLFAAGLVVLGAAETGPWLLTAAVLMGLGFGNLQSCLQAVVLKLVDRESMGLATSTFYIFAESGLGFGPYLLGLLVPLTGYGKLYMLLALPCAAGAVIYYFNHGRKVAS